MERKPLRLLLSEFVADEFEESGLSVREFAKKIWYFSLNNSESKSPNPEVFD